MLALLLAGNLCAQQKETVHSVVVVRHEASWYETQMSLWKADVDKNQKDANAWYNYYSAVRALRIISEDEALSKKYDELCHDIAKKAYEAVPETFEGNHLMHKDGGTGTADEKYLEKAYAIAPNDPRITDDIMIYGELKRDQKKFHDMAVRLFETQDMPGSMLNWAYNLLAELDENAVVFSAGDNDTYALWIVQEAMNFRPDVQVINTFLIREPKYRSLLFKELGLPQFEMKEDDTDFDKLYQHILKNDKGIPVYASVSALGHFEQVLNMDSMYLTGLAYKYSDESFDNMSVIRRNYEKRYYLDHLEVVFTKHIADERATYFKSLYLPSLIKLYKHYSDCEENEKKKSILDLILRIGKETDQVEEVNLQLKEIEN